MGYNSPAVAKAIRVLELLCESSVPLTQAEIGRRLGLNNNMTFRLLRTLQEAEWVVKLDGGYGMGLRPFHYTSMPVARQDVRKAGEGPVRDLWRATGESTYLGILDGLRVLYLESLDGTGPLKIAARVGGRYELNCSAPGKVLLAYAGEPLLRAVVAAKPRKHTVNTITAKQKLAVELKAIRERGYALDREEYADGLMCFAAPIRNYEDRVVATVGISVLTLHYSLRQLENDLGPKVLDAAAQVSAALGAIGPRGE
jgi:DNA-binding IclR family transcriptional regulator